MNTILKSAMTAAGYPSSTGDAWTVRDAQGFRDFCFFKLGAPASVAESYIQYPQTFIERLAAEGIKPVAATEAELETPAEEEIEVAQVSEPAPFVEEKAPVVEAPVVEAPADEAEEAPAAVTEETEASDESPADDTAAE